MTDGSFCLLIPLPYLCYSSLLPPRFPFLKGNTSPVEGSLDSFSHQARFESPAFCANAKSFHLSGLLDASVHVGLVRRIRAAWHCHGQSCFLRHSEHVFCLASTALNKIEPLFKYLEILQNRKSGSSQVKTDSRWFPVLPSPRYSQDKRCGHTFKAALLLAVNVGIFHCPPHPRLGIKPARNQGPL